MPAPPLMRRAALLLALLVSLPVQLAAQQATTAPDARGYQDRLGPAIARCLIRPEGLGAVSVELAAELAEDGRAISGSIRLLSGTGGTPEQIDTLFRAARLALLRCTAAGLDLPQADFARWRHLVQNFTAEGDGG